MASLSAAPNTVNGSYTVAATSGTYSVSFALTSTGTPCARLIINTTSDALMPGPGQLSLREAIAFNEASPADNAPITFDERRRPLGRHGRDDRLHHQRQLRKQRQRRVR